jgi:tetraacyldisaccharide 4'-kinase
MSTVERWVKRYSFRRQLAQILPVEFQVAGLHPMLDSKRLSTPPLPVSQFLNRPVIAFSGIANPEAFEQNLQEQGLRLVKHFRFEDHHNYSESDAREIMQAFRQHQAENPILVTTDKDLPKVRAWMNEEIQKETYTLQRVPALDGRWFYDEFITQLPGFVQIDAHAHSTGRSH